MFIEKCLVPNVLGNGLQIVDVHRILGHKGLSFPSRELQCETKKLRGEACKTGMPIFQLSLVFVFPFTLSKPSVIHLFGQVLHLL